MPPKAADGELPSTKSVVSAVFGAVKDYSKLAAQLPLEDYDYHLAFPGFRRRIRDDSETLVALMDACSQLLPKRRRIHITSEEDPHSGAMLLVETERNQVMDTIDSLLENVDSLLDEVKGRRLDAQEQLSLTFGSEWAPSSDGWVGGRGHALAGAREGVVRLAHVQRPQLFFETPVDNSAAPFVPKYYDASGKLHTGVAGEHPFRDVIKSFTIPESQLLPKVEVPPVPLEAAPLTFVETVEAMSAMVKTLSTAHEIAVDLEHHDYYSYQGFTCLMQISTREEDFIVDCLQLRSSMGLLAPVFLNSSILKVFHGAREDVRWLQKDFGLYLVNFFDTGLALQALHMPYSLAFAVDHFCQVKLNKKYQTADWRVRPLSAEMVHYARQDTHFLLYVYDRLKALLLNSEGRASIGNLLVHVYNESRQLSLLLYEKPMMVPDETYKVALGRSLGGLNKVQQQVARNVFEWRESAARDVDDSPTAVLHLSSVLTIASKLPITAKDLLRCCTPATAVVRDNVAQIVGLVKEAVEHNEDDGAALAKARALAVGKDVGEAEDDGATRLANSEWAFYRSLCPTGVHRPMTGSLPSLATVVKTVAPRGVSQSEQVALLSHTTPSAWFTAMQTLSRVLADRPRQQVELPGADIFAAGQAASVPSATKKEQAEEDAEGSRKNIRSSSVIENALDEEPHGEEKEASPNSAATSEQKTTPTPIPLSDKQAISIKQVYGIGSKTKGKARKVTKGSAAK